MITLRAVWFTALSRARLAVMGNSDRCNADMVFWSAARPICCAVALPMISIGTTFLEEPLERVR
jgi:hypothetical protein